MAPVAPTYTYTDREHMNSMLSAEGVDLRLDDDADGTVEAEELAYLTDRIISTATEKINYYLSARYAPIQLKDSYWVWEVCTVVASRMLCARRGNPVPESLELLWDEAKEELNLIRQNKAQVPRVKRRETSAPAWSNMVVNQRYYFRKIRVQRGISEKSTTQYPQDRDRSSENFFEF